ncbi:MAG: hypothetical protein K2J77_01935 [Oscillospiraceae bacterium]|nr:hypothetical protein [Oscillospiraceae bacterium]
MKKDELLDLVSELKVDDAFVDEALGEQDGAPVRVYAGSSKKSPMRIVAPIAACLAVAAAAGFLVVNVNRGKFGFSPAASIEESSEVDEPKTFLEKCKDIVTAECKLDSRDNVVFTTEYCDIDFDGEDELLVYPKLIKGFGVRVFKGSDPDNIQDLGTFGTEADFVQGFFYYTNKVMKTFYYYNVDNTPESYAASIHEVSFDKDTNKVKDETFLKYVTTRSDDTLPAALISEKAYCYDEEIPVEGLFARANSTPLISIASVSDWDGMLEFDGALAEKYNMPVSDINSLAHSYSVADVNNDGKDEVFIRFDDSEQLRGLYVFGANADNEVEFMGEVPHEGEFGYGNPALINDMHVHKFNEDNESYCYFVTVDHKEDGCWEGAVNKIIVNEDGTFDIEKIVVNGQEKLDDGSTKRYYRVNGEEVSGDEFDVIFGKYARK